MERDKSISQLLAEAGYGHFRVNHHGPYRHAIWRTSDGTLVGYFTADEACRGLLGISI